jgi:hypothetical protein
MYAPPSFTPLPAYGLGSPVSLAHPALALGLVPRFGVWLRPLSPSPCSFASPPNSRQGSPLASRSPAPQLSALSPPASLNLVKEVPKYCAVAQLLACRRAIEFVYILIDCPIHCPWPTAELRAVPAHAAHALMLIC